MTIRFEAIFQWWLSLSIYLPAMADCQYQNNQLFVLNFAQHSIDTDSISPESGLVSLQWFSKMPGVLAPLDSIIKPVENPLFNRPVQFSQLPFSHIADLNRPGQVLFSVALMAYGS